MATQLTLNSVDYNENLVIDWTHNQPPLKNPSGKVGEFIDSMIEKYKNKCQLQPDGHTIYLPLEKGMAKAMSVNENGEMVWTELEAVTRHPPINKDGTNTLIKIKTESGREVIATKAKSFLTYKDDKIIPIEGSSLKIGDLVPIVNKIRPEKFRTNIDLKSILDPKQVVFTDYMIKAKDLILEANKKGPKTPWFSQIKYFVPYNSSDSLRVTIERALTHNGEYKLENTKNKRSNRSNRVTCNKYKLMFENGMVYPKNWTVGQVKVNGIPSIIKLDREFGFLVGAYLSEGCVSKHQVGIANNNENYRNMATTWTRKLNISDRINQKINEMGESTSIFIHSTLLRDFLVTICGQGSYEKKVPSFAYSAPDDFVKGLLDGYICGDGNISKNGGMTVYSRSKSLRDGVSTLLTRFNIITRLSESMLVNQNDSDSVQKPLYSLSTSVYEAPKLEDIITAIDYKHERLLEIKNNSKSKDRRKLNTFNDLLLDPITSIKDYIPDHPYVYDLTVKDTKNMTSTNGICLRDKRNVSLTGGSAVRKNPNERTRVN